MEANALKQVLVYSVLAVVLGLALVLVPLVTLAEIGTQNRSGLPEALSLKFREVESSPSNEPKVSESDVEVLGLCFVLALVTYVLSRRKTSERKHRLIGRSPYYF